MSEVEETIAEQEAGPQEEEAEAEEVDEIEEASEEEEEAEEAPKAKKKPSPKPAPKPAKPEPAPKKLSKSQQIQEKMAKERSAKVAAERKKLEAEDKVKFTKADAETAKERVQVKAASEERAKKERANEKVKKAELKGKAAEREERKAARAAVLEAKGKVRCPGSNTDVEKAGLKLTSGNDIRKEPWSKRGKRVRCPKCKRSVGIHTKGRKKTQKAPTSYHLNTHYVKVKSESVEKPTVKAAKKETKAKAKKRAAKK